MVVIPCFTGTAISFSFDVLQEMFLSCNHTLQDHILMPVHSPKSYSTFSSGLLFFKKLQ